MSCTVVILVLNLLKSFVGMDIALLILTNFSVRTTLYLKLTATVRVLFNILCALVFNCGSLSLLLLIAYDFNTADN